MNVLFRVLYLICVPVVLGDCLYDIYQSQTGWFDLLVVANMVLRVICSDVKDMFKKNEAATMTDSREGSG